MKAIFLTMFRLSGIAQRHIYADLLRKFRDEGHVVYIVTPYERSLGKATEMKEQDGVHILGVKTLNLQKNSIIEKGIGQVLVEGQYKRAIDKYLKGIGFDLIIYSTPPITFPKVITYLKQQNPNAMTYLLLKDIFPQNAVDIGIMDKTGLKGLLYNHFRNKEKKLYAISDYIGCMSPANVEYVLKNNHSISCSKVEIAPNSIELNLNDNHNLDNNRNVIREKYGLPTDKPIFIYGGNLGKPQGIPYVISF